MNKILLYGFLVFALLIGVSVLVFNYTYSEGNRAGVVIKFSKKGFIFKTHEGELNMGGVNNLVNTAQVNQIWEFSVLDKSIADSLMKMEGKRVSLHYQERIKNLPWQGDTKYFVDGFQELN